MITVLQQHRLEKWEGSRTTLQNDGGVGLYNNLNMQVCFNVHLRCFSIYIGVMIFIFMHMHLGTQHIQQSTASMMC